VIWIHQLILIIREVGLGRVGSCINMVAWLRNINIEINMLAIW